jgi:Peptidase C13 family
MLSATTRTSIAPLGRMEIRLCSTILSGAAILARRSGHEVAMTFESWIRWLGAPLVAFALTIAPPVAPVHAAEGAGKVGVVSFGLFGDQGVFRSESAGAAEVVTQRFEAGPVSVQYNFRRGGHATIEGLARSLQETASRLDAEKDVLFLILTSHGSPDGLAITAGRLEQTLTPSRLAGMLAATGVRHKVVVISACYSGVFIPPLASPDVLVITAADENHPSFGCEDKAKWTYFGDAFFNVALRRAPSLKDAFLEARTLVRKRELREKFDPSNPQMAGGENVLPLLASRP